MRREYDVSQTLKEDIFVSVQEKNHVSPTGVRDTYPQKFEYLIMVLLYVTET